MQSLKRILIEDCNSHGSCLQLEKDIFLASLDEDIFNRITRLLSSCAGVLQYTNECLTIYNLLS